jgi:hypothetical protein
VGLRAGLDRCGVVFLYVILLCSEHYIKAIQNDVLLHRCVSKRPILRNLDPHFFVDDKMSVRKWLDFHLILGREILY